MYKEIPGFSNYRINREGEMRCKVGNVIIPWHRSNGYWFCHIVNDNGERLSVGKHRALALAFIPLPDSDEELVVNHIDGSRDNNQIDNLEWVTRSRNQEHAYETGSAPSVHVIVTDLRTNESKRFYTKKAFLNYYGLTNHNRIFDGKKVVLFENLRIEFLIEQYEKKFKFKFLSGLALRDIQTDQVTIVANLNEASAHTGIETKVIKRYLQNVSIPYPVKGYEIRPVGSNQAPWMVLSKEEREAFKGLEFIHNPIMVTSPNGTEKLFGSVLRASEYTGTYERTIRECTKTGAKCARGFRYKKYRKKHVPDQ